MDWFRLRRRTGVRLNGRTLADLRQLATEDSLVAAALAQIDRGRDREETLVSLVVALASRAANLGLILRIREEPPARHALATHDRQEDRS